MQHNRNQLDVSEPEQSYSVPISRYLHGTALTQHLQKGKAMLESAEVKGGDNTECTSNIAKPISRPTKHVYNPFLARITVKFNPLSL